MPTAVIISCLALAFTVGSFYWIQVRKGRLKLFPISTFSASINIETLGLRLPVMVYNSGARPRVLTAIRLIMADGNAQKVVLGCQTFRKTISATSGDLDDFAHPYVVAGRSVVTKYADFKAPTVLALVDALAEPRRFTLEALVDDQSEWVALGTLEVHTEIIHTDYMISYSNNSGVWPAGLLEEAAQRRRIVKSDFLAEHERLLKQGRP